MNYSQMTDAELNELAAEAMGWTIEDSENEWGLRLIRDADGKALMDVRLWQPATDLNQAVMLENKIIELGLAKEYSDCLMDIIPDADYGWRFALIHATARQRVIAFLSAQNVTETHGKEGG